MKDNKKQGERQISIISRFADSIFLKFNDSKAGEGVLVEPYVFRSMVSFVPWVHIERLLVKSLAWNHLELLGAGILLSVEGHELKSQSYFFNCLFQALIVEEKCIFVIADIWTIVGPLDLIEGCGSPVLVHHAVNGAIATIHHYFCINQSCLIYIHKIVINLWLKISVVVWECGNFMGKWKRYFFHRSKKSDHKIILSMISFRCNNIFQLIPILYSIEEESDSDDIGKFLRKETLWWITNSCCLVNRQ